MSLLNKLAVGALATVGALAVKNRKAIAKEVKTDLRRAKRAVKGSAAKTVKRKARKQVSPKKRSAATKRTKTGK